MTKKLHSFRCTDDLWDAITSHADAADISANEMMERLIASSLGLSEEMTSEVIAEPIADLQKRVSALEKAIAGSDIAPIASAIAEPISKPIAAAKESASSDWLTTGEAREAMQQRHGYSASPGTFRRHLRAAQKQQTITPVLRNAGVSALDFAKRAAANPKSNAVRWVKVS